MWKVVVIKTLSLLLILDPTFSNFISWAAILILNEHKGCILKFRRSNFPSELNADYMEKIYSRNLTI